VGFGPKAKDMTWSWSIFIDLGASLVLGLGLGLSVGDERATGDGRLVGEMVLLR